MIDALEQSYGRNYYTSCPSCQNDVKIIGIGIAAKDAGQWKYTQYQNAPCVYTSSESLEQVEVTQQAVAFYTQIRNHFDEIVLAIEDALQIRADAKYWKQCLKVFLKNQEYCYPWLTDANVPYIFALLGMVYSQLFGLRFKDESDICNALEKIPDIILSAPDKDGYRKWEKSIKFTELQFRFLDHKCYASEGQELKRSLV